MSNPRTLECAVLTLAGMPAYYFCAFAHICMAGHMQHGPYPAWHYAADLWWLATMLCGAIAAIHSTLRRRFVFFAAIVFLVVSRWILGSGGGGLILVEAPLYLVLAIISIRAIYIHRKFTRAKLPTNDA